MSTTDVHEKFGLRDPLEAQLVELFATRLAPGTADRLDERMGHALRAWRPELGRRRLRPGRRAGMIALLAAGFAIAGASGGLRGLHAFLVGPFDVPWQRGVELNLSQVVDGYRVTIDRAYADSTRLALAISVVDELERAGTTQLMAMATIVTDGSGGEYGGMGATSGPDGPHAAANVVWKSPSTLPLPAGPRRFHVVIPHIEVRDDSLPPPNADDIGWSPWHRHAGPWTFDFELTVDGGTVVTPSADAEIDGVRVRVTRLIAASSIVRVELQVAGDPSVGVWSPAGGELRHGGRTLRVVAGDLGEADGTIVLLTDGGVRDASGEWVVSIDALDADDRRLTGPWVIRFHVP